MVPSLKGIWYRGRYLHELGHGCSIGQLEEPATRLELGGTVIAGKFGLKLTPEEKSLLAFSGPL
jgi:hypothetical protein